MRKTIAGYEIDHEIGRGGQAQTFFARDRQTGSPVVLKRLAVRGAQNWKAVELFEREGEVLQKLEHEAVPNFIDAFHQEEEDGRVFYLVQTHVVGENLETVAETRSFEEEHVLEIARQILTILDYLHTRSPPVLHRDLKPANLILTPGGQEEGCLSLVDFGAAQAIIPVATDGGSTVVGTYGYMPPEQFAGRATPASDLYALGATLVFLLSGHHPVELDQKRMQIDFRAVVDVSPGFALFLDHLLEPLVEDRMTTAAEALKYLDRLRKKRRLKWRSRRRPNEKILSPGAGSWMAVRLTEDTISAEIPPLHSGKERLRALLAALVMGASAYGALLHPELLLLMVPLFLLGGYQLVLRLLGSYLHIDRKGFTMRNELLGIPWRWGSGRTRTLVIDEERDAHGEPMSTLSVWSGFTEKRLARGLDEEDKAWFLDVLGDELFRLRGDPQPGHARSDPMISESVTHPFPEQGTKPSMELNLLPV